MKLLGLLRLWPPFGGDGGQSVQLTLAAAIRARILASVPTAPRVYYSLVEPNAPLPVVVFSEIGSSPTITSQRSYFGTDQFQFTVLSDDDIEAQQVCRAIITALSLPTKLRFADGLHMTTWVGSMRTRKPSASDGSASATWCVEFDATFMVQRNP